METAFSHVKDGLGVALFLGSLLLLLGDFLLLSHLLLGSLLLGYLFLADFGHSGSSRHNMEMHY